VSKTVTAQLKFPSYLQEVRSKSPSTYTGQVLQMILGILKQTFCFSSVEQTEPVPVFRLSEQFSWTSSCVMFLVEELFETLDFV
jgi:hypothetical protein